MAWAKAGTTTLSTTASEVEATITANKSNQILNHVITAGSGNIGTRYRFNDDSGSKYAQRWTHDGGWHGTSVNQAQVFTEINDADEDRFQIGYLCSISGEEKLGINFLIETATGAGSAPQRSETVFKYVPSPDATITSVKVMETVAGSFGSGTNLTVLGSEITPAAAIPALDNVQDNSLFVDKVNARRYWFDAESTNESAFYSASDSTVTYTDGEDVSSKATNIISMAVSPDGTHFYVGEEAGGIHQYDLGTAWDISTAVWQREYTHGVVNPKGLFFSTDGTKMYLGIFNTSDVKRYPLTTAWDVSTVQTTDQSYSTGSIQDLWFSSDGTKMFWSDNSGNVKKLVLGTAWTINSNTSGSQTVNPSDITGIGALQFKPDGTRMFLGGWDSSGRIKQYALATAFDLSTVSFTQEYNASAQTSDMQGMALSATGDKFFVLDQTNDYIRQYDADTIIPATWINEFGISDGLIFGGVTGSYADYSDSQSWNGVSWTAGGNLTGNRASGASAGTGSTSARYVNGYNASPAPYPNSNRNESYNGTAWTSDTSHPDTTNNKQNNGCGTADNMLVGNGHSNGTGDVNNWYKWTGSWTSVTASGLTGHDCSLSGTLTSAIQTKTTASKTWNGTAWTSVSATGVSRSLANSAGTNSSDAFRVMSTGSPPTIVSSELWNGTAWTASGNAVTAKSEAGSTHNFSNNMMVIGGQDPSAIQSLSTQEYRKGVFTTGSSISGSRRLSGASG